MRVRIKFVKQDCWIGVYWKSLWTHMSQWSGPPPKKIHISKLGRQRLLDGHQRNLQDRPWQWGRESLTVYICIIPCFPIILEFK